jgi:peptide/nickel transport system ATP-binding protein
MCCHPHEVSDGKLQRACLARAPAVATRYLICDEISSMLDVSTQADLFGVVAQVQREGAGLRWYAQMDKKRDIRQI